MPRREGRPRSRKSYPVSLTESRRGRRDTWPSLLHECGRRAIGIAAARHDSDAHTTRGMDMLSTVLVVVLVLALIGALPAWPYSAGWGFFPSGGLDLIVLILVVLAVTGRL